jgi:hypothetical protein
MLGHVPSGNGDSEFALAAPEPRRSAGKPAKRATAAAVRASKGTGRRKVR